MKRGSIAKGGESAPSSTRRRPTPDPRKVPIVAAIISLMFPGLGHLLIPARLRGAVWLLGWLVLGILGAGVPALLLHVIAGVDAYVYGRQTLPVPEEGSTT